MKKALRSVNFNFYLITFSVSVALSILFFIYKNMNPSLVAATDYISYLTGARILLSGERNLIYEIDTQIKYQSDIVEKFGAMNLPFKMLPQISFFFLPSRDISCQSETGKSLINFSRQNFPSASKKRRIKLHPL